MRRRLKHWKNPTDELHLYNTSPLCLVKLLYWKLNFCIQKANILFQVGQLFMLSTSVLQGLLSTAANFTVLKDLPLDQLHSCWLPIATPFNNSWFSLVKLNLSGSHRTKCSYVILQCTNRLGWTTFPRILFLVCFQLG